jgi:hypothetical protein
MTNKHIDPAIYLLNSVQKRGKSSADGVYLTHIVVTTLISDEPQVTFENFAASDDAISDFNQSSPEWNEILVRLRRDKNDIIQSIIHRESHLLEFITEGHDLSLCVIIPSLQVSDFEGEVRYYQTLLKKVAQFAGSTPTQVRFTIGVACISWSEMVESGDAQEIDVGF